jgi:putative spermidine/putrescine transport system substrate-binding protein
MVAAKRTTPDDNYVDIGFYNSQSWAQGCIDGLWDKIEPAQLSNYAHVLPAYRPANNLGIGNLVEIFGLMYNKKLVTTPPTSWADMWSPAYKGKVVLFDYNWDPILMAAHLNGGSASNIEPGFQVWQDNIASVKALVTSNDQLLNLISSGSATLAPFSNDVTESYIKQGSPVGFAVPKEGGEGRPLYMAVTTNLSAAQKQAALDFVNAMLDPDAAGAHAANTNLVAATDNAVISEAQKADPLVSASLVQQAIEVDWLTVGQKSNAWHQEWDQKIKSKLH